MRIGDDVIRVSHSWNDKTIGDVRKIDGMKVSNGSIVLHLEGDKPDTWNSCTHFRLVTDIDIPMLAATMTQVAQEAQAYSDRMKAQHKKKVQEMEDEE